MRRPGHEDNSNRREEEPRAARRLATKHLLFAGALTLICGLPFAMAELGLEQSDAKKRIAEDWREDWAVPEGFSVSIDTEGYHYPTAIAFVPNPGDDSKDPLYFVTELRGKVKVVTNDRSVHTFASGFLQTEFHEEVPSREAEFGLAGICLDPAHGYVFITFAYQDDRKILRNNIIRFETTPGAFSLKPRSQKAFTDVFARYESGPSHQIGPCKVHNEMLYVSVGDGYKSPLGSQQLDSPLGKILRMDLNGKPVPTNPFYVNDDIRKARNYVWAYGLRNPFSLEVVDDNVIVADNGMQVDRFLEVREGQNYLWDGTDQSIATNAAYVFLDSESPVQMDYYPAEASFFPESYASQFYVALGAGEGGGVMRIPYGLETETLLGRPEYFVRETGESKYNVGLAFGPDGLYVAPLNPIRKNKGAAIIKVRYEPENAHAVTLTSLENPAELAQSGRDLMREKGCFGCHRVKGVFDLGGTKGPELEQGSGPMVNRILQKISSEDYVHRLQELDALDKQPFELYEEARERLTAAEGIERVRIYMKYQILEPRFDDPYSTMPNLGLSEAEAEAITRFLLPAEAPGKGLKQRIKNLLPEPRYRYFGYAFAIGVLFGLPLWLVLQWIGRLWSRRR